MRKHLSHLLCLVVIFVASPASASTSSRLTRSLNSLYEEGFAALTAVGCIALLATVLMTVWGGGFTAFLGKASNTLLLLGCGSLITGLVGMAVSGGALL